MAATAPADRVSRRRPLDRYRAGTTARGVGVWRDWVEWWEAYPFEVAAPGEVFSFLRARGFELTTIRAEMTTRPLTPRAGTCEYVAMAVPKMHWPLGGWRL
jgi:hypothetical protein